MNYRVFLTPAYLTSLALALFGLILVTVGWGILGWIVLLLGLALNVVATAVIHHREELRRAEGRRTEPRHHSAETPRRHTS